MDPIGDWSTCNAPEGRGAVGPRCQENTRRKHFIFPYADVVGPYYHPLHVQSSVDSSCLLTMLTMREGGTAASAANHAKDDGKAS